MLALTILQPWAWAIQENYKPVENRTWRPPAGATGKLIAIHAGKRTDPFEFYEFEKVCRQASPEAWMEFVDSARERLQYGAVIAVATLSDVVSHSPSPWFFGPVGWVLANIRKLQEPILCRGQQGLWTLPEDVEARVRAQIGIAA